MLGTCTDIRQVSAPNTQPRCKSAGASCCHHYGVFGTVPQLSFQVQEIDGDLVVTSGDFRAVYYKPSDHPLLVLRSRTITDDHALLARAWQAADAKARELGWIV
jgi:hypothetical protein